MNAKRILVLTAIITVLCTACSNKENQNEVTDTTQAESGSTKETEQAGDSKQNNKETEVTKENFRDYPVSDESIFGFDVVEGGLQIGGCKRDVADKVIVVPETINGKKVVSIGFGAFSQLENVEAIVLPDSVVKIGEGAFTNCDNLRFVYLGTGLKSTGNMTFNMCKAIKEIELPEGMTSMQGIFVFNCPSLEVITVPATVEDVGDGIVSSKDFNGVIRTPAGSAAEKYAIEHGIKVENY